MPFIHVDGYSDFYHKDIDAYHDSSQSSAASSVIVLMPESPQVSPKTCVKHGNRSRRSSLGISSIEELAPDEMGYDGDIETLQPNEYEDVESDAEEKLQGHVGASFKPLAWPDIDGELAGQMRQLSWRQTKPAPRLRSEHSRGQKQQDLHPLSTHLNQYGKRPELEIAEVRDGQESLPPSKRLRKRSARSSPTKHGMRSKLGSPGSTSDQTVSNRTCILIETTESTGLSDGGKEARSEAMDVD